MTEALTVPPSTRATVLLTGVGYAAQRLLPFVAVIGPAVVGAPTATLGRIELVFACGTFAGAVGMLGMEGGVVVARARVDASLLRIATLVAGSVAGVLAGLVGGLDGADIAAAAALGAALAAGSVALARLRARQEMRRWMALSVAWLVISVVIAAGLRGAGASWPVAAAVGASAGGVPAVASASGRPPDALLLPDLARLGLPLWAMTVSLWVMSTSDRFFLSAARGSEELGEYALVNRYVFPIAGLLSAFGIWWSTEATNRPAAWVDGMRRRARRAFLAVGVVAVIMVTVLVVDRVASGGPGADPRVWGVGWLLLGYTFQGDIHLEVGLRYRAMRTSAIGVAYATGALVNVIGSLLVAERYGLPGVACTTAIGFGTARALLPVASRLRRLDPAAG